MTVAPAGGVPDAASVEGFGREWAAFDQSGVDEADLRRIFDAYFAVFPWDTLTLDDHGIDIGCGSGRWARFVAPRVGRLTCVDASEEAVGVACKALAGHGNVEIRVGWAGALPFPDRTFGFGYSLGVLHHTPDPEAALRDCVRVLKPGAPFLVYLYYALDGRPGWYRAVWQTSDRLRQIVSRLPFRGRYWASQAVAALVYWPLARGALRLERLGARRQVVDTVPLAFYRDKPFYVMRNDALDRLGTRVEHRFTRAEVYAMLHRAGIRDIEFSAQPPFWVAVGRTGQSV
ncbi:MAG TPA: class I SAM-dependent methyltransferase [Acidimicrobiia bacterium]|nr:class I SAM-dependent methyltransferase [Acidimicrobiia bacterium]